MWIMQDNVWWQAFDDPFVLETFVRRDTLRWVPLQTEANEIDEGGVWHFPQLVHDVSETLLLLILRENF